MRYGDFTIATPDRFIIEARKGEDYSTFLCASLVFLCTVLIVACSAADDNNYVQEFENLIIISEGQNGVQPVSFIRESAFSSSKSNLIGRLGQFDVADDGRVYIADAMQHRGNVFDQAGRHLNHFGREGSGPGEFRAMGALNYSHDNLFVYDPLMMRLSAFSTDTYDESVTIQIQAINKREVADLDGLSQSGFFFINPDKFLVSFTSIIVPNPSYAGYNLNNTFRNYHIMDRSRKLDLNRLFKLPNYRALSATVSGQYRFTQFEFLGSTIITTSENAIYMARSDEFLIQVFDTDGKYQRAYYAPVQNVAFTREDAIMQQISDYEEGVFEWRVSVIENAPQEQIPETWPVLENIILDNEDRIWVSTIVKDFDVYEWWVLEESGDLITKFEWPRDEPIEVIQNGKMYTRETDEETGLQQVVKYRIEFGEL